MNLEEMREVLENVHVPEFEFKLHEVWKPVPCSAVTTFVGVYLQGHYNEKDIVSKQDEPQSTRKWPISEHATKSELVQTAFKCYLTSMEHRARESFRYKGKLIYGPHFDCDALWEICKDQYLDYRRTDVAQETV